MPSSKWDQYAEPAQAPSASKWDKYAAQSPNAGTDIKGMYDKIVSNPENNTPPQQDPIEGSVDALKQIGTGLWNTVRHPIDTATNLIKAQGNEFSRAKDAYGVGDYPSAAMHLVAGITPIYGPQAVQIGEDIGSGHAARGLTNLAAMAGTEALSRGISNAEPPIGARIGAEESKLDQMGVVPKAQDIQNALDTKRQANMTSQGVPYTAPLDKRFGKVNNQIEGIYTDPANPPKFSELSKLKSTLQKEASPSFFDTGKVVANKQGAGEASRAIRGALRDTPGAEDWAELQDKAARGHRIDERVGKATGAIAGIAAPYVGLTHGEGPLGLIGAPLAAKMGAKAGQAASHYITSGEAANQLKPIGPAIRALPLVRKEDENED